MYTAVSVEQNKAFGNVRQENSAGVWVFNLVKISLQMTQDSDWLSRLRHCRSETLSLSHGTIVFSHFLIHFHSRSILPSSAAVLPVCPAGTCHDQPRSAAAADSASSATPAAGTRPTKERTQAGRVSQQKPVVCSLSEVLKVNGRKVFCQLNAERSL